MRIRVHVIPRSNRNTIAWEAGIIKVRLTAPPVDGAANEALIALLAEHLGVAKRNICIVHGAAGRQKTVEIIGMTPELMEQKNISYMCCPPGSSLAGIPREYGQVNRQTRRQRLY